MPRKKMSEYMRAACQAQAALEAWENASNYQLLGTVAGGRMGDHFNEVIQLMIDSGMYTDEQLEAYREQFDLNCWRDVGDDVAQSLREQRGK